MNFAHGQYSDLRLVYQPIVDIKTGQIRSLEALLRSTNGLIDPPSLLATARQRGDAISINEFVLQQATKDTRTLRSFASNISVSINMSPGDLIDASFVEIVNRISTSFVSHGIMIELTEGDRAPSHALHTTISTLRANGYKFSLDDFGVNFSNFDFLFSTSFDQIKFDRTFLRSTNSRSIMLLLARELSILLDEIVVEGVETEEDLLFVRAISSTVQANGYSILAQGYHVGPPLPLEDILSFGIEKGWWT